MEDEYLGRNVTVRACINLMWALDLQVNSREMKEVHCVNVSVIGTPYASLKMCAPKPTFFESLEKWIFH